MPIRKEIFENNQYYHVFNKTIDRRTPFDKAGYSSLFLETAHFYRCSSLKVQFSLYRKLPLHRKNLVNNTLKTTANFQVNIIAYAIMPNHYHFVVRQAKDNGISNFIANLINSFTRFYNISTDRKGPIFMTQFHAVPIITDEQLLKVCRYVHMNHLTAGIVSTLEELKTYRWNSFGEYFSYDKDLLIEPNYLMSHFSFNLHELMSYTGADSDSSRF